MRNGVSRFRLLSMALVIMVGAACDRSVPGQEAEAVSHAITVDSLFTLDLLAVDLVPGSNPLIAVDTQGDRFVYAPSNMPNALHVFDGTGSYLESFSQRGEGPAELTDVQALAFDAGDLLWVFSAGRVDIWSPELVVVRSHDMPLRVQEVKAAPAGGMFIVGRAALPDAQPHLVHSMGPDGQISPVGPDESPAAQGDVASLQRSLGPADDGSLWIAGLEDYKIRRVGPDGEVLSRIDAPPEWWGPADEDEPDAETMMFTHTAILDLDVDCHSNLWVVAGIPRPEHLGPVTEAGMDPDDVARAVREQATAMADHAVRVYRADGEPLAEAHFDFMPLQFQQNALAFTVEPDSALDWRVVVRRLGLTREDPREGSADAPAEELCPP